MRHPARFFTGLVFTAGLILLPTGSALHAAPAADKGGVPVKQAPTISFTIKYLASVEGVSPATLQQDLQAGQTLLRIAGDKYSSAADLATALLAPDKLKLDHAASGGKFTPAEENQQYTALLNATETLVVTPHPALAPEGGQKIGSTQSGFGNVKLTMITAAAENCDTTVDALLAAVQGGNTSILGACQATNPAATVAGLSTAITTAVKAQLDAAVSSGKLAASQESDFLASLQTSLAKWLTSSGQSSSSGQKA
ncbi:MAG TPA: hypothetical protein VNL71_14340 [Chloroflexota bacterium]|nr:hypothetical protein [Chloroflexota bacterium]